MTDVWFGIVAFTLTMFVLLDGYDFGAGMLHLFVARGDAERRQVLAAIGPFWDGNEVWLLAAGGALFLAFPRVLGAGLSGFYFAIFLVIWCLVGRGVAVELRSHVADPLWRALWDAVFACSSLLLALFFGVALGNVVRGVPLDGDGWFALALFTDFRARPPFGILDVYTLAVGVFAVVGLLAHGGLFLAWRTDGPVRDRARAIGLRTLVALAVAWPAITAATAAVRPGYYAAFGARPAAWAAILVALAGIVLAIVMSRRGRDRLAFAGSAAFLGGLLVATAICAHPALLHAEPDAALSLTTANAAAPADALRGALAWYLPGLALALAYPLLVARLHRAPARPGDYGGH